MSDEQSRALAEMAQFPDMNPVPVFRFDRNGKVLLANRAARRVFGRNDLAGESWLRLCPGMTEETWRHVLDDPEPPQLETEVGGVRLLFTHVRSEDGALIFAFGADVTVQRQNELLLAIQARFPDMNPGPVLRVDLAGDVLVANRAAREVFGRDLVGLCWRDMVPEADRRWAEITAAPDPVSMEAVLGDQCWVFTHRRDHESDLVFVYGADITYQKKAEQALRQSEKMATLGTLVAGVAHELNNPAAATGRAAEQLREAIARLEQAHLALERTGLGEDEQEALLAIERQAREQAARPIEMGSLERSDREAAVEVWLEERGVSEAWVLAPVLVAQRLDPTALSGIAQSFSAAALPAVLAWAAAVHPVYALLNEVSQGSSRISEIVRALKSYSYLGQAPILAVDVHEGLDNTLVILRSKIKAGISVHREYGPDLPPVMAYGGELNQAWTNLIDNAVDALGGKGNLIIRTWREGEWAVVEIEDDGPGIPPEIQSRIFDPFFTTKAPGHGTGLGLSTTYSVITEKHRGRLAVESRPGLTRFTVKLPIAGPKD